MKTLGKNYLVGNGNYPRDMAITHNLLVNYKTTTKSSGTTSDRITFKPMEYQGLRRKIKYHIFYVGYQDTTTLIIHASKRTS